MSLILPVPSNNKKISNKFQWNEWQEEHSLLLFLKLVLEQMDWYTVRQALALRKTPSGKPIWIEALAVTENIMNMDLVWKPVNY